MCIDKNATKKIDIFKLFLKNLTKAVYGDNFLSNSPVSGNNTGETKTSGGKNMKTFVSLALTLVLTAATLVGCGCTNQKMDNTSAPTVLPTNEEIWNSTEATTRYTTESTLMTETTDTTGDTTDATRGINETEVQNHVNAHNDTMDRIRGRDNASTATESGAGSNARRIVPGTR
jgi:hypothetical protein